MKVIFVQTATLMNFKQLWPLQGMNRINLQNVQFLMPNNFRKYPLKQNLRTFKDFFINSRSFKVLNFCFQIFAHTFKLSNLIVQSCVTSRMPINCAHSAH